MALSGLYFLAGIIVGPLVLLFLPPDYQSSLPWPLYALHPLLQLRDLTFYQSSAKDRFSSMAWSSPNDFPPWESHWDVLTINPSSESVKGHIHHLSDLLCFLGGLFFCRGNSSLIISHSLITQISGVFFIQTLILAQYFYCCFVFRHPLRKNVVILTLCFQRMSTGKSLKHIYQICPELHCQWRQGKLQQWILLFMQEV